jgi:hypothetical protein
MGMLRIPKNKEKIRGLGGRFFIPLQLTFIEFDLDDGNEIF